MSMIPCTQSCIYQMNGQCILIRSMSPGFSTSNACVHFIPISEKLNQCSQSLTNIRNTNQFQSFRDD